MFELNILGSLPTDILNIFLFIFKFIFPPLAIIWYFTRRQKGLLEPLIFFIGIVGLLFAFLDILSIVSPETWRGLHGVEKLTEDALDKAGAPRFLAVPPLWVIFLLIVPGAILFVSFIYAKEKKINTGTKILLSVIRILLLALIILALFEPTLILRESSKRYSHTLIMLDSSKSMNQRDLFINRWSESEKTVTGFQINQFEAIRSQSARDKFGDLILKKLILNSLHENQNTSGLEQFLKAEDYPLELDNFFESLNKLEIRMKSSIDYKKDLEIQIKDEYSSMLTDFLDSLADNVLSLSDRERIKSNINLEVNAEKQAEVFFNQLNGKISETHYLYLLVLRNLIYDSQNFDVFDKELTKLLRTHFAKFKYISPELKDDDNSELWRKMPRDFGLMDSFAIAVQWRRMLRLYNKLNSLFDANLKPDKTEVADIADENPNTPAALPSTNLRIPLGVCHELFNQKSQIEQILKSLEIQTTSPQATKEDIDKLEKTRNYYQRFNKIFLSIFPDGLENQKIVMGLENIFETAKGLRRFDIACELLHPNANFEGIIDKKMVAENKTLLKTFSMIENLKTADFPDQDRFNKLDIRAFSEGAFIEEIPAETSKDLADALDLIRANGNHTEIGKSCDAALRSLMNRHIDIEHLSSVVIVSDGLNNQGEQTTPKLKEVEVNTIAVGSRDTLHHLELFNLQAPTNVSKSKKVTVNLNIRADEAYQRDRFGNPGGKKVEILLYRVQPDEDIAGHEKEIPLPFEILTDVTPELVGKNTVNLKDKFVQLMPVNATQDLILDFTPEKGIHFVDYEMTTHFRLRINKRKYVDEDTFSDNTRDFYITFTNKKIRVLYIEGRPRYEWRYLNTVLQRDKSILYQGFMTSADKGWPQPISINTEDAPEDFEILNEIPRADQKEKFFETYDVVILGDVAPYDLGKDRMAMFEEFVDKHKGGFVIIAGESYMPKAYYGTILEDIVPVKLGIDGGVKPYTEVEKHFKLTAEGLNHEVLRLSPDMNREELKDLWENRLHGFFWFFNSPEVKEGANVLMVHPGNFISGKGSTRREYEVRTPSNGYFPLMVWMDYGKGGILYFGTDDLWYIRGGMGNKYYAPFWSQVVSQMSAKKRDTGDEIAEIYTQERNNPVYDFEVPIDVYAKVSGDILTKHLYETGVLSTNSDGNRILQAEMRNISLKEAKSTPVTLVDKTNTGRFYVMIFPDKVGNYEIWIKDLPNTVHNFKIVPPLVELQPKPINVAILSDISHKRPDVEEMLKPHCFYPPNANKLIVNPLILKDKTLRTEEDLWDAPLLLVLIILLLSVEWIIRKRGRLL